MEKLPDILRRQFLAPMGGGAAGIGIVLASLSNWTASWPQWAHDLLGIGAIGCFAVASYPIFDWLGYRLDAVLGIRSVPVLGRVHSSVPAEAIANGTVVEVTTPAVPLERQISVGEVRLQGFVRAERRMSLFVKGHNASAYRILASDPEGSIGVDDAERRRMENTGRPSLRHLWPDTRAGRPTVPGVPSGEGFELVLEARMPDKLADDIEAEFEANRPINLDMTQLELAVLPHSELDRRVRLALPASIQVRRTGNDYHSAKNIVLGPPRLESTSTLYVQGMRPPDAKD